MHHPTDFYKKIASHPRAGPRERVDVVVGAWVEEAASTKLRERDI